GSALVAAESARVLDCTLTPVLPLRDSIKNGLPARMLREIRRFGAFLIESLSMWTGYAEGFCRTNLQFVRLPHGRIANSSYRNVAINRGRLRLRTVTVRSRKRPHRRSSCPTLWAARTSR